MTDRPEILTPEQFIELVPAAEAMAYDEPDCKVMLEGEVDGRWLQTAPFVVDLADDKMSDYLDAAGDPYGMSDHDERMHERRQMGFHDF